MAKWQKIQWSRGFKTSSGAMAQVQYRSHLNAAWQFKHLAVLNAGKIYADAYYSEIVDFQAIWAIYLSERQ